jgi:hypothetical protein
MAEGRQQEGRKLRVTEVQLRQAVDLLLCNTLLLLRVTGEKVDGHIVLQHVGYICTTDSSSGSSGNSTDAGSSGSGPGSPEPAPQFILPPGVTLDDGATAVASLFTVPDIPRFGRFNFADCVTGAACTMIRQESGHGISVIDMWQCRSS